MTATLADRPFAYRSAPKARVNTLTTGDQLLQWLAVAIMLLEIVVFIEPAPVDAAIVLCLACALLSGKMNFSAVGPTALLPLGFFVLANLVSMYDARDMTRAASYVAITVYLIASWFLFTGLIGRYGKPLISTLIAGYSVAGILSALIGAGGYFHVLPWQDQLLLNGRARALFKDCNVYGPFFVPMALFAIQKLTGKQVSRRQRLWQAIIFVSAALGILLSFSRAAWANFAIALGVFLIGQIMLMPASERFSAVAGKLGFLVVAGAALTFFLNVPAVHSMLTIRVNSNHLQYYDRVRFATQQLAIDAAKEQPLGIGPGQSEGVFHYATHSMYVRILSENGPLALLALLGFIVATMARSVTLIRRASDPWFRDLNLVVFACIVGHLANSFVIDTVHWRHIWFIYALPWAATPLSQRVRSVPVLGRVRAERLSHAGLARA
jgi:O-antigen ligase